MEWARDLLPEIVSKLDEPMGDSSLLPTYLLCRFAKQYVTVMLTGEGGDELFGGYPKCAADQWSRYLNWMPRGMRRRLLRGAAWLLPFKGRRLRIALENHPRRQLGAIQRKLSMFQRFGFLRPNVQDNVVEKLLGFINQGVNVVLEFGRYGGSLEAYILVANYLTRRIHQAYVERKEAAQGGGRDEPKPLVITIEEAHKFLDPAIASQTIFGTIARELRKYNVTLHIVDQRPSGIDPEVMSQIGTRVTCLLDDESDIRAVFSGVSGARELRNVLAKLDTRQQALILGHAVPMPVVVRTRDTYSLAGGHPT